MAGSPRLARARLWAWVYLAVFGSGEETTDGDDGSAGDGRDEATGN